MTTIAYKDGIVAYDSRSTSGNMIRSDREDKHRSVGGKHFFSSGPVSDAEDLIALYLGLAAETKDLEGSVLVVDSGKLFSASIDDGVFFKQPLSLKEPYALGSGTPFAYTAMDLGCDAITAVKMAAKRDMNTGGRTRKYVI